MKVEKFEQKAVVLYTKGSYGRLITVAQIQTPEWDLEERPERVLSMPIVVSGYGWQEPIGDILDEREKLKTELRKLKEERSEEIDLTLKAIKTEIEKLKKKKWYEFWK